jgi:predicted dehydrogenase
MSARTRAGFTIPDGPYAARSVPVVSDDLWQLLLEFDGCVASLEAKFATIESLAPECELRCEGGGVAFSLLDVSAPVSEWREGDGGWTAVDVPHARLAGPDHILGVEHMVDCILGGAAPIVSAEHAIHVLSVIESARTAALGQVVTVPSSSWDPRIEAPSAGVRGAD